MIVLDRIVIFVILLGVKSSISTVILGPAVGMSSVGWGAGTATVLGSAAVMGIEGVTASNAATVTGIAMTGVVLDATANTLAAGVAVGNTAGGVSGFIASSTTTVLSILTTIMASGPLGWAMLGIGIIAAVGGEPITENTNKFNMTAYVEWKRVLDAEIEEILCNNYIR